MISKLFVCPKLGAELEDFPIPFPQVSKYSAVNRTKSCGYFGLEDLGGEYSDD